MRKIKINIEYSMQKQLEYLLKNNKFTKEYNELVEYIIYSPEELLSILQQSNFKYEIIKKEKIELIQN